MGLQLRRGRWESQACYLKPLEKVNIEQMDDIEREEDRQRLRGEKKWQSLKQQPGWKSECCRSSEERVEQVLLCWVPLRCQVCYTWQLEVIGYGHLGLRSVESRK